MTRKGSQLASAEERQVPVPLEDLALRLQALTALKNSAKPLLPKVLRALGLTKVLGLTETLKSDLQILKKALGLAKMIKAGALTLIKTLDLVRTSEVDVGTLDLTQTLGLTETLIRTSHLTKVSTNALDLTRTLKTDRGALDPIKVWGIDQRVLGMTTDPRAMDKIQATPADPQAIDKIQATLADPQAMDKTQATLADPQAMDKTQATLVDPQAMDKTQATLADPKAMGLTVATAVEAKTSGERGPSMEDLKEMIKATAEEGQATVEVTTTAALMATGPRQTSSFLAVTGVDLSQATGPSSFLANRRTDLLTS